MEMEPVLHRSRERISWVLKPTPNPGKFLFSWIQTDCSRGTYLLHCSLLYLCKKYFQSKGIVTKLGSLSYSLGERRCVLLAVHLAMMSSHCFFPPNCLGHWSCFSRKQSKKNTNHFPLLHALPINSTGIFQAPAASPEFSSEWNKTALALAVYRERQSSMRSTWGRNSVRNTMETQGKKPL